MTGRVLYCSVVVCLLAGQAWADSRGSDATPRVVLGADRYLSAGADAIRAGRYDEGIRLTRQGLERGVLSSRNRAAGLANLCAAHVARNEPDEAIHYCTESLQLNNDNWRPYSNRSHAYLLKGMYSEAVFDNDAAAAINPDAAHVRMIRESLNERGLQPRIIIEEHH